VKRRLLIGLLVPSTLVRQIMVELLTDSHGHEAVVLSTDVLDVSPHRRPDVLVVSSALLVEAVARWPEVPVLALTKGSGPEESAQALRDGAGGVIDGAASLHDLAEAVEVVAEGQTWLPPAQVSRVLACLAAGGQDAEREAVLSLTPRERQVMLLMGQGFTRREVAERLVVSVHTARTHVQNVLAKLDVHSQVAVGAIARRAVQSGWITQDALDEGTGAPRIRV
jgi:DNA-binding NarL/FixJ family response regulator